MTPHGASLLVFSLVSLPLSSPLPTPSSSYLIQIHSAAARLRGERRLREPRAADRRGERAPGRRLTKRTQVGSIHPHHPPTGADRREPVRTLISTTHAVAVAAVRVAFLAESPSAASALPRACARARGGQSEHWRLFTPHSSLPRVTPSDADGGTSRRTRTCASPPLFSSFR